MGLVAKAKVVTERYGAKLNFWRAGAGANQKKLPWGWGWAGNGYF